MPSRLFAPRILDMWLSIWRGIFSVLCSQLGRNKEQKTSSTVFHIDISFNSQVFSPTDTIDTYNGYINKTSVAYRDIDLTGTSSGEGGIVVEINGRSSIHSSKYVDIMLTQPGVNEIRVHRTSKGMG